MVVIGTFNIKSWRETAYDEIGDGPTLVRADVTTTFHGKLEGAGDVTLLMVMAADKTASFIGLTRVIGRIGQRSGSFALREIGTFDGRTVASTWTVCEGSGTDEFRTIRGGGSYVTPLGEAADYRLDVTIDPI